MEAASRSATNGLRTDDASGRQDTATQRQQQRRARRITANNTENELLFRGSGRATRRLVKMDAPRTDIASRHCSQPARQAQHHAASVPGLRLHDERTAILPRRHLSCSTERLSQRADELYISRVLLDCYLPIKLMEFV